MDVFQYAREKEQLAEKKYRELAESCGDKGLSTILTMLADEEAKHCRIIDEMKDSTPEMHETDILPQAKTAFSSMQGQASFDLNVSEIDVYKQAQEMEKASESFYREQAQAHAGKPQEEVFLTLAEEEKKHFFLLDNIIEFMAKPQTWLENAEFNHLDQY